MVNISNNNLISLTAGDYFSKPLFINAGDELDPIRYILQDEDKIYFSVMEPNRPFEFGILRKVFTKDDLNCRGDVMITLDAGDTENLVPGQYYYEIKLLIRRNNKDYVNTIVDKRKFNIL